MFNIALTRLELGDRIGALASLEQVRGAGWWVRGRVPASVQGCNVERRVTVFAAPVRNPWLVGGGG